MNIRTVIGSAAACALMAMPFVASAQYYVYPQNYQYQYPQYGAAQYPSYSYNTGYYVPTQYYQTTYPSSTFFTPTRTTSYGYGNEHNLAIYSTYPRYRAVPTGTTDALGTRLCYWQDYNQGATPCDYDPQQWVFDPYTGRWY